MKKGIFFAIATLSLVNPLISAPPDHRFPDKSFENYDIRSDNQKDGSGALTNYVEKSIPQGQRQAPTAARQLLMDGQIDLISHQPNAHIDQNPFGTAPEIVDIQGAT